MIHSDIISSDGERKKNNNYSLIFRKLINY